VAPGNEISGIDRELTVSGVTHKTSALRPVFAWKYCTSIQVFRLLA
jgi:hypothetical protein